MGPNTVFIQFEPSSWCPHVVVYSTTIFLRERMPNQHSANAQSELLKSDPTIAQAETKARASSLSREAFQLIILDSVR